jgi:hypothetical protein
LAATTFWKGAHREYWRDGWQQKLLDLDGIMGGGVDGPAACAGKLKDFRAPLRDDSFPARVAAVFVNVWTLERAVRMASWWKVAPARNVS